MACGCQGAKNEPKKEFQVTQTDGSSKTYKTEIEGRAAAARTGGALRAVPAKA